MWLQYGPGCRRLPPVATGCLRTRDRGTDCGNKAGFFPNEAVNLQFQSQPNTVELAFSSAAYLELKSTLGRT